MGSQHRVQIVIDAQNLSSGELQSVVRDLAGMGQAAEDAASRSRVLGSTYTGLAGELQQAADKARDAGDAFKDATKAIGGDSALARSVFPELANDADEARAAFDQLQASLRDTMGIRTGFDGIAGELQAAATKADVAKRAFQEAVRAIGGDASVGRSVFPDLAREVDQAEQELRELENQARQTDVAVGNIGKGFSGGGLLDIGSKLGNITTGIFAGTQMLGGFASAAASAGMGILGLNADLESTSVSFEQLTGSAKSADVLMSQLQDFAASTPFEFPELAKSARLLMAFGDTAEEVVPHLRIIGDTVSAFGGGAQEIDQVTRALGQMGAKGKVSAEEMNQLTEVGIAGWQILAEEMGKSTAEVMKLAEQGKLAASEALPMLYEGMERTFGGGMQRQAATFNGLLSNLKDGVKMAFANVTEPLFDEAKAGLERLVNYTSSADFAGTMDRWRGHFSDFAQTVSTFANEQGPGVLRLLEGMAERAVALADAAFKVAGVVVDIATVVAPGPGLGEQAQGDIVAPEGLVLKYKPEVDESAVEQFAEGAKDVAVKGATAYAQAWSDAADDKSLLGKQIDQLTFNDVKRLQDIADEVNRTTIPLTPYAIEEPTINANKASDMLELYEKRKQVTWDWAQAEQDLAETTRLSGQAEADRAAVLDEAQQAFADRNARLLEINTTEQQAAEATRAYAQSLRDAELAVIDQDAAMRAQGGLMSDVQSQVESLTTAQMARWLAETNVITAMNRMQTAQENLAGAYQIGLGIQAQFGAQQSEYTGQLNAMSAAKDEILKKQEAGIQLSQVEQQFLAGYPELYGRVEGGIQDATIAQGIWAASNAKLMTLQDQIQKDNPNLVAGTKEWAEAIRAAGIAAGMSGADVDSMLQTAGGLQGALIGPGGVNEGIATLGDLLRDLPKNIAIALGVLDEATSPVANLKGMLDEIGSTTYTANVQVGFTMNEPNSGGNQYYEPPAPPTSSGPGTSTGGTSGGGDGSYEESFQIGSSGPAGGRGIPSQEQQKETIDSAAGYVEYIAHVVQLLADAKNAMGEADEQAKALADAGSSVLDVFGKIVELERSIGTEVLQFGDHQRNNVTVLSQYTAASVAAAGESAAQYEDEFLEKIETYASAGEAALGSLSAAVEFSRLMGTEVVLWGEWQSTNVANLKFLTEHATQSVGDSAQLFSGPYLEHLELYASAAEASVGLLGSTFALLSDIGDTVVADEPRIREAFSALKFLSEHAAQSVGDSAQVFRGVPADAQEYAEMAGATVAALADTFALLQTMGGEDAVVPVNSDAIRENLSALKFLSEHIAQSISDSQQLFQGVPADVSAYAGMVSDVVGSMADTYSLLQDMSKEAEEGALSAENIGDNVALLADYSRIIADEFAKQTAGWEELPVTISNMSKAVGDSVSALSDTRSLLQDMTGEADWMLLSQEQVAAQAKLIAGFSLTIAEAFDEAAQDWDAEVNPAMKAFAEGAGSGLKLMGDAGSAIEAILNYGDMEKRPDVAKLAPMIADDMDLIVKALETANALWVDRGAPSLADYEKGVGGGIRMMASVGDAVESMADQSRLTSKDMGIFEANTKTIIDAIPNLLKLARPAKDDAEELAEIMSSIAAAMNATSAAIRAASGGGAGGGGGGGGSSSGGGGASGVGGGYAGRNNTPSGDGSGGSVMPGAENITVNVKNYLDMTPVHGKVQQEILRHIPAGARA